MCDIYLEVHLGLREVDDSYHVCVTGVAEVVVEAATQIPV